MKIVIFGLSVTSSWGNGHATTYRSLIRGLAARGHEVLFLERDAPWYAGNRDERNPQGARTELYQTPGEAIERFQRDVEEADFVLVGSFVPDGKLIGEWVTSTARGVTGFYDIDTPITLEQLSAGTAAYISPELIPRFGMYLSFTGGPTLRYVEDRYRAKMARELYCSVDTHAYRPAPKTPRWDLGYLGTHSEDRQPLLDELLLKPAREWNEGRFAVVGPMYPADIVWPANVERTIHLSPREHPGFYASQRFTLNITRAAMKQAGYSPSVRLFEAGACGAPIVSDWWRGLESLFQPGKEIFVARNGDDVLRLLRDCADAKRLSVAEAARWRILREHTPEHRAMQLESYIGEFHDHFSSGAARPNGFDWQRDGGMGAGMASQRAGQTPGGSAGGEDAAVSATRGVHESLGARH